MRPGPFGEAVSRHLPFPLPACPLRPKTWACFCMITMSLPAERAAEVEVVGGKDQAAPLRLGKPLRARTRAGNHAALCSPCSLCCRCRPPKPRRLLLCSKKSHLYFLTGPSSCCCCAREPGLGTQRTYRKTCRGHIGRLWGAAVFVARLRRSSVVQEEKKQKQAPADKHQ